MERLRVQGFTKEGYEPVKDLFQSFLNHGLDQNAQLCVYVFDQVVVDLWGTSVGNPAYNEHSIQAITSSTMNMSAIAIAWLVGQDLMEYEDLVAKHWPEFGHVGKDSVKVCDVLRHEAGLEFLCHQFDLEDLLTENIKNNAVGRVIEEHEPNLPIEELGETRYYHNFTRGWILNEIFRRVHPQRKTMREFINHDLLIMMDAKVTIGVRDEDLSLVQPVQYPGLFASVAKSMLPRKMRRSIDNSILGVFKMVKVLNARTQSEKRPPPPIEFMDGKSTHILFNLLNSEPRVKRLELTSFNGFANARGMAKVAAFMANRGRLGTTHFISEPTWEKMHRDFTKKVDHVFNACTSFSQGGVCLYESPEHAGEKGFLNSHLRPGFIGWVGIGGSVLQWHPEHKIGFGYAPTKLAWYDFDSSKGAKLQQKVVECLLKLQN